MSHALDMEMHRELCRPETSALPCSARGNAPDLADHWRNFSGVQITQAGVRGNVERAVRTLNYRADLDENATGGAGGSFTGTFDSFVPKSAPLESERECQRYTRCDRPKIIV
jgi:hypothetical protein